MKKISRLSAAVAVVLSACATVDTYVPIDEVYLDSYGSPAVYPLIKGQPIWKLPKSQETLDKIDEALNDATLTDLGRLALTEYRVQILAARKDSSGVRQSFSQLAQNVSDSELKQYALRRVTSYGEGEDLNAPKPLVRIPPNMPPNANNSGFCKLKFDVDSAGNPADVVTTYCTRSLFRDAAIKSVSRWKYAEPRSGETYPDVEVKVQFLLTDANSAILPY